MGSYTAMTHIRYVNAVYEVTVADKEKPGWLGRA
jgi:hypothetical protein